MKKIILRMFAIALIVSLSALLLVGCAKTEEANEVTVDEDFYERVELEDMDFSFDIQTVDNALAMQSDTKAAIAYLMEVADYNYVRADYLARLTLGGGAASASVGFDLEGAMAVRALRIREDDKEYVQSIGRVYNGDPADALGFARKLLDQGYRQYTINRGTDDYETYKQEPKNDGDPRLDSEEFPYAFCDFTQANVEVTNKENEEVPGEDDVPEFLKHPGELTNFVVDGDYFLDDSYSVEYNEDEGFYVVKFELDLTTQENRDFLTEIPRADLRKSAGSDDLEYGKYSVEMEIWDTGLIRKYSTIETWEATLILASFLKPSGASDSFSVEYYNWKKEDCVLNDYVEDGIISLDWIN